MANPKIARKKRRSKPTETKPATIEQRAKWAASELLGAMATLGLAKESLCNALAHAVDEGDEGILSMLTDVNRHLVNAKIACQGAFERVADGAQ